MLGMIHCTLLQVRISKMYFSDESGGQIAKYSKTCVKRPLSKRPKIGFQDQLSLNAGQKYCRMLQGEHSAILLTFNKLPFLVEIFVLSVFEWSFYTGFTVLACYIQARMLKQLGGGGCQQQRGRSACTDAQVDQPLCFSLIGKKTYLDFLREKFQFSSLSL